MANGKLLGGKPSGGVTTVTFQDGVSNTELVLPESGNVASTDGATVDNTIPRFDGVSGKLQGSSINVTDSGVLTVTSPTGGLGYGTGAGGTVTQLTSKSTAVTLNKPTGTITTHNASLAAGASVSFTMNNTTIGDIDTVDVVVAGIISPGTYEVNKKILGGGNGVSILIKNITGSTLSDSIRLNFTIIKGANS